MKMLCAAENSFTSAWRELDIKGEIGALISTYKIQQLQTAENNDVQYSLNEYFLLN